MRHISFFLTQQQVIWRTKFVTRRLGWKWLVKANRKRNVILQPVVKGQGIPKGGKVEKIRGPIAVLSVRREPLNAIDKADVVAEGFPHMSPAKFVKMFCKHNGCTPRTKVTRIRFEYL